MSHLCSVSRTALVNGNRARDRLSPVGTRVTDFLLGVKPGARVVVRSRLGGGFTDALGILRSRTHTQCVVETKRGLVTITLADVIAAKEVPPPPAPRPPTASV
jgi:hypothetical protein